MSEERAKENISEKKDESSKQFNWINWVLVFLIVLAITLIILSFFTPASIALGLLITGTIIAVIAIGALILDSVKLLGHQYKLSSLEDKLNELEGLPGYENSLLLLPETWNNQKIENVFNEIEILAQTANEKDIIRIIDIYGSLLVYIYNRINELNYTSLSQQDLDRQILFLKTLILSLQNIFNQYPNLIIPSGCFGMPENYFTHLLKQPLVISLSGETISYGILPIVDMTTPILRGLGNPKATLTQTIVILKEFSNKPLDDFIPEKLSASEKETILNNDSLQKRFIQEKEKAASKVLELENYLTSLDKRKSAAPNKAVLIDPGSFSPVLAKEDSLQKQAKKYFLTYWDLNFLEKGDKLVFSCRNKTPEQAQELCQYLNSALESDMVSYSNAWLGNSPSLTISSDKFKTILEIEKQHASEAQKVTTTPIHVTSAQSITINFSEQPKDLIDEHAKLLNTYFKTYLNLNMSYKTSKKNKSLEKRFHFDEITRAKFLTSLINKKFGDVVELISDRNGLLLKINQNDFEKMVEKLSSAKKLSFH